MLLVLLPMKKKPASPRKPQAQPQGSRGPAAVSEVRIIGGKFRGRKLRIPTDPRTRPMKNRVREAIYNLIGTEVAGKHAVDLFAGTGALGIEAISRGAIAATFIERHFPTAQRLKESLAELGATGNVIASDTFFWSKQRLELGEEPWLVFCSPPYDFYHSRQAEMLELIGGLIEAAPAGTVMVVEADMPFDMDLLPEAGKWDVRPYPPAVVAILRLEKSE